ncbi:MAG: hypothetical protein JEZ07_06360 [Phycisphaerae bacterium]|nr:hypothetical protein [Phycisphaerae bacterium]
MDWIFLLLIICFWLSSVALGYFLCRVIQDAVQNKDIVEKSEKQNREA